MSQTLEGPVTFKVYQAQCSLCHEAKGVDHYDAYTGMRWTTVPIGPVYWHIQLLIQNGHTTGSIAAVSGVPHRTVRHIVSQKARMTHRETAERILGVTTDEPPLDVHYTVPRARLAPFVEEMVRKGWSHAAINRATGLSNIWRSVHYATYVHHETWLRIITLYRVLAREGRVDPSLLEGVES